MCHNFVFLIVVFGVLLSPPLITQGVHVSRKCSLSDYPFFALVYNKYVCGATLIHAQWALLSARCLIYKLKNRRKKIRIGEAPEMQHRTVVKTKVCHKKMGCNFGVVKARKPFRLGDYMPLVKIPKRGRKICKIGVYVYGVYRHPWHKYDHPKMYCARMKMKRFKKLNDIIAEKVDDADYDDEYEEDEDDYDEGSQTLMKKDEEGDDPNPGAVHKHDVHTGGPLLCKKQIVEGFLRSYSRKIYTFSNLAGQEKNIRKLTGLTRGKHGEGLRSSEGKKKSGGGNLLFEKKFLLGVMIVFIFVN